MSAFLILNLDMPPSVNRIWRNLDGRTIRSRTYRTWLETAAYMIQLQRKGVCVSGNYAMEIKITRPDKRRRDLGNLLKAIEDACVLGGAITDDKHAQRIQLEWVDHGTGANVVIIGRS